MGRRETWLLAERIGIRLFGVDQHGEFKALSLSDFLALPERRREPDPTQVTPLDEDWW
jgi:hypothetical protein